MRDRLRRDLAPQAKGVDLRSESVLIGTKTRMMFTSQTREMNSVCPREEKLIWADRRRRYPQDSTGGSCGERFGYEKLMNPRSLDPYGRIWREVPQCPGVCSRCVVYVSAGRSGCM